MDQRSVRVVVRAPVHDGLYAGRGADGGYARRLAGGGEGVCISCALFGEFVEGWCYSVPVTVTSEVWADVFAGYPKYVGAFDVLWHLSGICTALRDCCE